jgi:hypothetical protein
MDARVSVVAATLFATAEITLGGAWRWGVFALAVFLSVYPSSGRSQGQQHMGRGAVIFLLIACGFWTRSPVFVVLAGLLALNRQRPQTCVGLALAALGVHILFWRYLAAFDVLHLPSPLASVASSIATPWLAVLPEGISRHGETVNFSVLPAATVLTPIVLYGACVGSVNRPLVRVAATAALSVVVGYALALFLTTIGHVHFFSWAAWPLLMSGVSLFWCDVLFRQGRLNLPTLGGPFALCTVVLLTLWHWNTGPVTRPLRVAFDEAHGKWETVDAPLSTSEYGRHTVYNYVLLRRWLETKHDVTVLANRWHELSSDVLIAKMPVEFYSAEEKASIDTFLRRGGLLLVIGDHTNLYGTALVINDLLGQYGLGITATATAPWDSPHYDFRPAWWQRSRYLSGVQTLQIQTGARLVASNPAVVPIVIGDRVTAEDADYSNERFFGDLHPGPEDQQAPVMLAAERRVGKGRIILFGDSTIFSTFSFMTPGNREIFQNFLEQGASTRRGWGRVGLIAIVILLATLMTHGRVAILLAMLPIVVAFAAFKARGDNEHSVYPGNWLNFDRAHSRFALRADPRDEHGPDYEDFSTFFGWVARTGAFPRVTQSAFDDPTTPAVILNPDQPFTANDIERIEHFVKRGGRLLLMDDPRFSSRSTIATILERFGITLMRSLPPTSVHDAGPPFAPPNVFALPFEVLRNDRRQPGRQRAMRVFGFDVPTGLSPMLVDDRGTALAGRKDIGSGSVVVFLRSTAFSEAIMGDVWVGSDVSHERRMLYQLEFDLLESLRSNGKQ